MCYLVAKWFDEPGCVALSTVPGQPLVELKRRLDGFTGAPEEHLLKPELVEKDSVHTLV